MSIPKLEEFLNNHKIKYLKLSHSAAFTAQEIAASAHVSGKHLAKAVVVKMDGKLAMVVVPANTQINFGKLKQATAAKDVNLANESEFKDKFPDCEVGAMPPIGEFYNMPVYLSDQLAKQDVIVFNAGTHSELIQMQYSDFERIAKPKVVNI